MSEQKQPATKHPGRSPAQRRVLDAIGCGNYSPIMAEATRKAMLGAGLIVELPSRLERDGPFTITIRQFEMPTPVHMAWCNAVADDVPDDALL